MADGRKNPPTFWSMFRDWRLTLAAVGAVVALIAAAAGVTILVSRRNVQTPLVAPGFVLRDEQGQLTSLAQFRGKVVVLTFIDPECQQICPLTTQSMVEALKILGPAAASQVQLLGIDANPLKTQVSDVAAYTRSHELEGRWRFLTGTKAQLENVWHGYHVYVAAVNNDIDHEAVVILIDGRGDERIVFSTPMSYEAVGDQARTLAEGIARLLPGHPTVPLAGQASQQEETPIKRTETVSLTSLGANPKNVVLGGAHPHLMLFFAGWLGQDGSLSKSLAALDSYAATARRRGWPSPVAVDELTTEPSPAEAQNLLDPLAATLRTPIVEDKDGRIADGYLVEDLPWFVLCSPSGKILWRHDGWVSAADLSRNVRTALAAR